MMEDNLELPQSRRWPLIVAIVAGVIWLGLAALALAPLFIDGPPSPALLAAAGAASAAMMLAAPLAVIWLVAGQLRDRSGANAQRTDLMARHALLAEQRTDRSASALVMLEDRLSALTARIEAIAGPIERQHENLLAAVGALETAGAKLNEAAGRTNDATVSLTGATPAAVNEAERLTALLEASEAGLHKQIADAERMLTALHEQAAAAEAQARATATETVASLTAIETASTAAQTAVAAPLAQLVEGVDAAFARTAAAMDATRDGVHAQTNAMLASVDQARVTLDHIGGEAARQIGERLENLLGTTGQLGGELDDQSARFNAMIEEISRSFSVLDAKLGNSATTGSNALEGIAVRMTEAREAIHRLGEPIGVTEEALATVESRLSAIGLTLEGTLGSLQSALPAAMPQIDDMALRLGDLHERADQLSLPLRSGGDSIAAAQAQLEAARDALDTAATKLGEDLSLARNALADIETQTGSASLAASTQLIEVFGRVRDIANQTAGTMRETLTNVVAEAEAALDQVGSSRAELAFGVPIRAQLAQVETMHDRVAAAAQAASDRITQRLVGLTETVAKVEQRIDEVDTRFEVKERNTLARRSSELIDAMHAEAIDIAGLLSFDIEDSAWDSYMKGDRSIFARRVAEHLDANGQRAVERHFHHDPEFRVKATHYIEEFEKLISHVLPDREGKSLSVALLSSNVGRLYVSLAQAADRFN
ncbi:hypothetical protein [Sandarakinorhabdus sp. DWP1-3-1]|uniref:hypothetical protein n=1 Tax=Sandarakinorhabdus sp. DWP1-3-1 TaxID=2804627 RepID=UPI003CF75450